MTYPPAGFGGDPTVHGQPPQDPDPAWWDHPTQQTGSQQQAPQPGWPGQQQADPAGWQPTQTNWIGQQGYPQQPGYPQDAGYAQQPGFQQNPGFPQQPGFPPPQPPKSNTGLIIGVVLGAIVVLAVAVGAIVLVSKKDDSSQADATTTTTTSFATSAPATTRSAPTTSKSAPGGSRFSYTEYGKDWNFKLGDVALQATYVSGRDYDSCAPIEESGTLTGLGCTRASEMAWKSENGALMLTQLVLTMSDAGKASSADGQFDDQDVVLPDGSYIKNFETGKWKDGNQDKFLVITVGTATPAVDEATVEKYVKYRHSDTLGALAFR
ncbi:hypothetical protein ACFXPS_25010 [Nocardia sp. NPDC059091]|uniref:hypothetical protein n=1 Tax=unclassified Nocardia TaxID=2637762 RepID=UPI0036B24800